jgi:hypothetical protein
MQYDRPIGGADCSDYLSGTLFQDVECSRLHFDLGVP